MYLCDWFLDLLYLIIYTLLLVIFKRGPLFYFVTYFVTNLSGRECWMGSYEYVDLLLYKTDCSSKRAINYRIHMTNNYSKSGNFV